MCELALDLMPDPLAVLEAVRDPSGRIVDFAFTYANRAAAEFFGLARELVGRSVLDLLPAQRHAEVLARYTAVVETGEPLLLDRLAYQNTVNGTPVTGVFALRVSRMGDGIASTWRDVTAAARAEEALRFQATVLDGIDAAVVSVDAELRFDYWNRGAERMLGWTSEEVLGAPLEAITRLPGPDQQAVVDGARSQATRGESAQMELEVLTKDGSPLSVLVRFVPRPGHPPGATLAVLVDVTALKAARRAAAESAAFLTAVVDNMAEGMAAVDEEGRLTFLNVAGERLLGWHEEDLLGHSMHQATHFEYIDGTPYPVAECPLLKPRTTGQPVSVPRDIFIRRDGTRFPVSYSSAPLRSDGLRGAVVVFQDITERLAEELRVEQELQKVRWLRRIQRALDEDQFTLYAQPIMDLRTQETVAHELLLRLQEADGHVVAPSEFLAAAEDVGMIDRIDEWVISRAAAIAAAGMRVHFNLSAKSVVRHGTAELIADALAAAGVAPEQVTCEITETALVTDFAAGEAFVRALRRLGCGVSLDDFGVGFGSLTYVKRLPVTSLKIDRQFVQDLTESQASLHVVQAVVHLARAFGVETIAEGAEDLDTVELLRSLDVDCVQGFVIGRPQAIDQHPTASEQPETREKETA